MDADETDFVYFGAPIEREEDTSIRKRKAAADAGQLRALPSWKQEVRDEEGRRRFHGAFTGGFSAGYYNTVGSKEGWIPQSFTSSRKNRAEVKQQSIFSFLDEDEKEELGENSLKTLSKYDTFGFTAAEVARKQAEKEQNKRPSIIPGPIPEEIVLPAANSIGIKLLLKMGWRHGHSIKDSHNSLYDAHREARKAFLALSGNTGKLESIEVDGPEYEPVKREVHHVVASTDIPEFVMKPKRDLHGLGFDPFKHAPEFRERKEICTNRSQGHKVSSLNRRNLFSSNSGKVVPGFGIGALEELDFEDDDIYDPGFEVTDTCLEDIDPPSKTSRDTKMLLDHRSNEQSGLAGFKPAQTDSGYKAERFPLPNVPHHFDPHHKFSSPLDAAPKLLDFTPPPEVSPPSDCTLRMLIEGFATLVCRCGKLFEDLSREKNKDNPLFSFLSGGHGHEYYARMLWESQQKHIDSKRLAIDTKPSSNQKMTAESRGRVLGERPLEKSSTFSASSANQTIVHFQSNLSDTFTKPASHSNAELAKPFKDDPSKQARFEQFLKDKFEGGLRSTYSGRTSGLSEADRACERLDFEAALETIQKGEPVKASEQEVNKKLFITAGVETSSHLQKEEMVLDKIYPRREEFQWRPAPVLCKRFDISDPFMGKPPPLPRARSQMESLVFTSDFVKMPKTDEAPSALKASSAVDVIEIGQQIHAIEPDKESAERSVQKPVDLYKAIFSDDSDDDNDNGENPIENPSNEPEKKTEGVNIALNRLVAGDFLESLGRELGLDVPTDMVKSSRTPTVHGMVDSHSLSKQHKFSTAKTDDTAASREVSANRQVKPPGDEENYQASEHNLIVDAVDHIDLQNRAMHLGYSTESEKGMSKTIGSQIIETKLERYASHMRHLQDDGCPDGDLPADRTFRRDSEGHAGMERAEIQLEKHRTTSRHHTSGSSPYRDSARGLHQKKHRSRSRHQRHSESDTESSDEHHVSRRYSSTKKSQEHKQRHRDRSEKSSKSHSSRRGERDHSHDERESEKSRGHHKVSLSSRADSHKKHR